MAPIELLDANIATDNERLTQIKLFPGMPYQDICLIVTLKSHI